MGLLDFLRTEVQGQITSIDQFEDSYAVGSMFEEDVRIPELITRTMYIYKVETADGELHTGITPFGGDIEVGDRVHASKYIWDEYLQQVERVD